MRENKTNQPNNEEQKQPNIETKKKNLIEKICKGIAAGLVTAAIASGWIFAIANNNLSEAQIDKAEAKIVDLERGYRQLTQHEILNDNGNSVNAQTATAYGVLIEELLDGKTFEEVLDILESKLGCDVSELRSLPENTPYHIQKEAVDEVLKKHVYGQDGVTQRISGVSTRADMDGDGKFEIYTEKDPNWRNKLAGNTTPETEHHSGEYQP